MLQLTYISTITRGLGDTIVEPILAASRRRNAAAGVTGLLLFDGRRFLQALEGEPDAVRITFDRIAADPRHRAIVRLSERQIDAREFGEWAMACQQVAAPQQQGSLAEAIHRLTDTVPDLNTRELFRGFAKLKTA
ncbi:BLUF domain-containing protein [Sphingomonas sp. 1P06PA]|uniref:BLUF domain-containing protein n=1 Tax=Sphingomonas sp. 1P06PA TaxID=554121 RepID=UPI0039A44FEB